MASSDMSASEQISAQVMHLLSGLSAHGDRHLAEVERDLVQMDGLLDEAIKKLCASFMAVHSAVAEQQQALDGLLHGGMSASDYAARVEIIHGEINRHVGAAVTGLQFQDMTSQLIGRMVQHLTGLRDVFGALDSHVPILPESSDESLLDRLNRISERVGARCSEQACGVRSTVDQRHMESGDIELF